MRGSWQRLLAAAAASFIVAGTVALEAQELRDRERTLAASRRIADDLRRARIHYGPFYLLSSIQLADIGYDQQFFVPTADTSSGFRFGLSAPTRLYITPNRKTYFSIDVTPEWTRFSGKSKHDQFGYKTRADAQFLLNHLYLDAYGISTDTLRADTGEFSSLLTRKDKEAGVTGELKYSSRTSVNFTALTRQERFPVGKKNKFQPDFPVDLLDRNEHSYRVAFEHKTFPLTSVVIAAEYAGYAFPQATFKDSHRTFGGLGLIYESGRTGAQLEGGFARLDFKRGNQRDFKGGVGTFNVNHRITDRWRLSGGFSRDLDFSIFADNNYYVANRVSIETEHGVGQRWSVNAGWTGVQDDYDIPTTGSKLGGLVRRRDRTTFPKIGFMYSSPNHFRGGADIGYLRRTSNFPIGEAEGIRLVLHLSLTL